jgi:hypothetical protein
VVSGVVARRRNVCGLERWKLEAESPAANGEDEARLGGIVTEDATSQHDSAGESRVAYAVAGPRPREELVFADDMVRVLDQEVDGIEHARRDAQWLPQAPNLEGSFVELERAESDGCTSRRLGCQRALSVYSAIAAASCVELVGEDVMDSVGAPGGRRGVRGGGQEVDASRRR